MKILYRHNQEEVKEEYFLIGGKPENGICGRTYNFSTEGVDEDGNPTTGITTMECLTAIRSAITDWNWHLNPDNDGTGVDFYFTETNSYSDTTLRFEEVSMERMVLCQRRKYWL